MSSSSSTKLRIPKFTIDSGMRRKCRSMEPINIVNWSMSSRITSPLPPSLADYQRKFDDIIIPSSPSTPRRSQSSQSWIIVDDDQQRQINDNRNINSMHTEQNLTFCGFTESSDTRYYDFRNALEIDETDVKFSPMDDEIDKYKRQSNVVSCSTCRSNRRPAPSPSPPVYLSKLDIISTTAKRNKCDIDPTAQNHLTNGNGWYF